jgi:hypothetical protein
MQGASYLLDRTYTIEDAAGVGQFLAVVQGTNDAGCKKPTAANDKKFKGITQEAQTRQNKGVACRKQGVSYAVAAGNIAAGDWVNIADATGKLQSCQASVDLAPGTAAQINVIGQAESAATNSGDIFLVFLAPHTVKTAVS